MFYCVHYLSLPWGAKLTGLIGITSNHCPLVSTYKIKIDEKITLYIYIFKI